MQKDTIYRDFNTTVDISVFLPPMMLVNVLLTH